VNWFYSAWKRLLVGKGGIQLLSSSTQCRDNMKDRVQVFSEGHSRKTKGNRHKPQQDKFHLDVRKMFSEWEWWCTGTGCW